MHGDVMLDHLQHRTHFELSKAIQSDQDMVPLSHIKSGAFSGVAALEGSISV